MDPFKLFFSPFFRFFVFSGVVKWDPFVFGFRLHAKNLWYFLSDFSLILAHWLGWCLIMTPCFFLTFFDLMSVLNVSSEA